MPVATRRSILVLPIAAVLLAGTVMAATPAPPKKLTLAQLPAIVQKTVQAESKGFVIHGIFEEKGEDGKPVYEVEMKAKGLIHDIVVGEDGTVQVSEQQVLLESLPAPVRTAMVKTAAGRKIGIIESVTLAGKLAYYEAQVGTAKVPAEIKIAPDGKIVP